MKLITNSGKIINNATSIIDGIQISLNLLAQVVMDNHITLDFLLASYYDICTTGNISCYTWINEQTGWNRLYIILKKKLFGFQKLILMAYRILLLAWVGQLGFLILKQLKGIVNCSCFVTLVIMLVCCITSTIFNVLTQPLSQMIATMIQNKQTNKSRTSCNTIEYRD